MNRIIAHIEKEIVYIYNIKNEFLIKCDKTHIDPEFKIKKYIENADFISILLDKTKSILDDEWITHCETLKSDGKWIWSGALSYYYEKHGFIWPLNFINNIIANNYNTQVLTEDQLMNITLLCRELKTFWSSENSDNFMAGSLVVPGYVVQVVEEEYL